MFAADVRDTIPFGVVPLLEVQYSAVPLYPRTKRGEATMKSLQLVVGDKETEVRVYVFARIPANQWIDVSFSVETEVFYKP